MNRLQGVPDTLFIPLVARIDVSKRYPEYFYDEAALSLEKYIPDEKIRRRSFDYVYLASVSRCYNMDCMVSNFIKNHGRCNIINLGAGLETIYFRLKNQEAIFYEIDLPEVIEKRRLALGEFKNDILLGGDLFGLEWIRKVDTSLPSFFIASGVFHYFPENQVVELIQKLKESFPQGELAFDATNWWGIKFAAWYVRSTGNTSAQMYFFVNNCEEFARKTGTVLLERRPFFIDARRILAGRLGRITRLFLKIADSSGCANLIHLRL